MTPEQAAKKREYDENLTGLLDTLPRMLWSMFVSLKGEGFSDSEALYLVGEMISGMFRPRAGG